MIYLIRKCSRHALVCVLIAIILSSASADSVFNSGNSINSLSISSNRSENNYQYSIEIMIEGIETSKVKFETDYQTLYLFAHRGGIVSEDAIAGAQTIRLAFNFPANANLKNYFRENKKNRILISVPKS